MVEVAAGAEADAITSRVVVVLAPSTQLQETLLNLASDAAAMTLLCWSTAHRDERLGCLECPGQPEISFHTTAANSAMIFC